VKLPCTCFSGPAIVCIPECLYVPQQQFNILSVHHLKSLGHLVDLHNNKVTWNNNPQHVQPIHWLQNLPYLLSCTPPAVVPILHVQRSHMSAAQHDHYNHARLGHMSQQKQMILSKLGLLATQDIVQSKRLNCEACILGSSCKDPTIR
jgi:hypothetical protein